MIIKIPRRRAFDRNSFPSLINYIASAKNGEKTACTGAFNLDVSHGLEKAIEVMNGLSGMNRRCRVPLFHVILSWREGEIPTKEQCSQAVSIYLKDSGLESCACFWGLHRNTDNYHLHICANRIDPVTGRAIQVFGGWKKIGCEHAARKIELTQGWQPDRGKFWDVEDGEIVRKYPAETLIKANPSGVTDMEHRTGIKSALTLAKERAADFLFRDTSWMELHRHLGDLNMKLEMGKKGLVLFVGETGVKPTSISGALSTTRLVNRLGSFIPPPEWIELVPMEPVPVEAGNALLTEYVKARSNFLDAGKKERARIKCENALLKEKHRREFRELYSSSWAGRRRELDFMRNLLSAWQREERERLKERHRLERKKAKGAFLPYEEWLRARGMGLQADIWRYRLSPVCSLSGVGYAAPLPAVFPGFTSCSRMEHGAWVVDFSLEGGEAAFTDRGERLDVYRSQDKEAIRAALSLAGARWGEIEVKGTQEFKDIAAGLAAEHGFRLKDMEEVSPELAGHKEEIERARRLNRRQVEAFEKYHGAVAAEGYEITVIENIKLPNQKVYTLTGGTGKTKRYTAEEVICQIPYLCTLEQNRNKNANVYFTPVSSGVWHMLVDDVKGENNQKLLDAGYRPNAVLESSKGNFQYIINVPKIDGSEDARSAANDQARVLNMTYGDKALSGAKHAHRAPGFHNFKEKNRLPDGTFPEVRLRLTRCGYCEKTAEEIAARFEEYEKSRSIKDPLPAVSKAGNVYEAYRLHAQYIISRTSGEINYSVVDGKAAVSLYVAGYSQSQICSAIEKYGASIRPPQDAHKHRWSDYARRTAYKYLDSPKGQEDIRRALPYRDLILKREGRWTGEDEGSRVMDPVPGGKYWGKVVEVCGDGTVIAETSKNRHKIRHYLGENPPAVEPGDEIYVRYGATINDAIANRLQDLSMGSENYREEKDMVQINNEARSAFKKATEEAFKEHLADVMESRTSWLEGKKAAEAKQAERSALWAEQQAERRDAKRFFVTSINYENGTFEAVNINGGPAKTFELDDYARKNYRCGHELSITYKDGKPKLFNVTVKKVFEEVRKGAVAGETAAMPETKAAQPGRMYQGKAYVSEKTGRAYIHFDGAGGKEQVSVSIDSLKKALGRLPVKAEEVRVSIGDEAGAVQKAVSVTALRELEREDDLNKGAGLA